MEDLQTIDKNQLEQLMRKASPDYSSRSEGYALVNTLPADSFKKEHIVQSINVPTDNLEELANHFDSEKRIIVYCASRECDSSSKAARKLQSMGFKDVVDFEGGLQQWKEIDGETASGMQQPDFTGAAASA